MTQLPDIAGAVAALRSGGVIAYPTEAVYGLGCNPHDERALDKIISLKGRDDKKGMIVIAADYDQVLPFLAADTHNLRDKICAPELLPTTWIVDAAASLSDLLTGGRDTIAVRITGHVTAATICASFGGAITSTSANISTHEPARSADQVLEQFNSGIDVIIDAPLGSLAQPTRIIDARTDEVLR
ncbi:MAG: L-threonylcarbamoyladenylate synthase [Pseudomonadota bacterium]